MSAYDCSKCGAGPGFCKCITAQSAAEKTLTQLGYTYTEGAELWRPPAGKKPDFDLMNVSHDNAIEACVRAYAAESGGDPDPSVMYAMTRDMRDAGRRETLENKIEAGEL